MTDYHKFTSKSTPKSERQKKNVGDIYINAAICYKCGEYIRSRNRHDFVTCSCGNVSVDGGSNYAKRGFETKEFQNIIVPFDDVDA